MYLKSLQNSVHSPV